EIVGPEPGEIAVRAARREEIGVDARERLPLFERRNLRAERGLPRVDIERVARRQPVAKRGGLAAFVAGALLLVGGDVGARELNVCAREIGIELQRLLVERDRFLAPAV